VKFDVNTVQPGIMRLIPGITEGEIAAWLATRGAAPFKSRDDFQARAGLKPAPLAALKF
jgi:type II secretion system (T2SS) protein K